MFFMLLMVLWLVYPFFLPTSVDNLHIQLSNLFLVRRKVYPLLLVELECLVVLLTLFLILGALAESLILEV